MVVDVGTGDGRGVLARARARPDTLVVGVDAAASSMAEASRRAARPAHRGGLPNALFVWAAAEALPVELTGSAHAVSVLFPWGSLLSGLVEARPDVIGGLARIARPGAVVHALISLVERDRHGRRRLDPDDLTRNSALYGACGLELREARSATAGEIAHSGSSWARRLGAGTRRPVIAVTWRRRDPGATPGDEAIGVEPPPQVAPALASLP